MTAVAEDLDLSWVTFGTDPCKPCEGLLTDDSKCPAEALFILIFEGCGATELALCLPHKDMVAKTLGAGGLAVCTHCNAVMRLLRIEPVR